jgi:class 3 adenylate cyclase/GAF domain-containing protein
MQDALPSAGDSPTPIIQRISQLVQDMSAMLRAQRDLLAQRGMHLSPEPLEGLTRFGENVRKLLDVIEENRIELQRLRELARTTEVINSRLDLDHVLSDVIDTVIALTRAERGYIVLKHPETGELEFRVARNMQQADLADDQFIVSSTVVRRVAEQGEPVVTINAQEDARFSDADSIFDYMLRSILCVPLKRKGQVIGVIYADNRYHQGLFGEREQQIVYAFANQAAIAIENARLFERLRASLAEITATKAFMDDVFSSIGSGVIAADRSDLIEALNAAAARILDIEREANIGQSLWSVLPPLYEGFQRLVADVRDQDREQVVEVEPVLETRGQINLNLKLSPFKDSARVTQGVAIVLDDLTAQTQQAAQLSLIRRYMTPAMLDNIQTIDELELGGVERQITVFYCDVRGFTTFSERLSPEELLRVINHYLAVCSNVINTTAGIIDKYMGDAAVGLYNTQLNPQADHALRAVQAAVMLVEGVQSLHQTLPPERRLLYGIGVHTGPAILGNVGSPRRKEFTAIGETMRFAKLLQENALGGEVLLSRTTFEMVREVVHAEPLAPRKLKDQPDFEIMYRVSGMVAV